MQTCQCLISEMKHTLQQCERFRLVMMLCGNGQCVKEDGENHHPVKPLGLHNVDAFPP